MEHVYACCFTYSNTKTHPSTNTPIHKHTHQHTPINTNTTDSDEALADGSGQRPPPPTVNGVNEDGEHSAALAIGDQGSGAELGAAAGGDDADDADTTLRGHTSNGVCVWECMGVYRGVLGICGCMWSVI